MIYCTNPNLVSENTIPATRLYLINLLDKWLKSIDKGELAGAIFFYLRKAFDVVNHELLLKKLSVYNFQTTPLVEYNRI